MGKKTRNTLIIIFVFFIGINTFWACLRNKESGIFLTREEKEWLKKHEGQISIGYTTDYPPIEFLKNGQYVGMTADYFKLLEEKLGIKIKMVEYKQWTKLLQDARENKISGITAATKTKQREEYLNFTVPYIFNPNVIITRKNFSEKLTFEKLVNSSMKVVAIEDYSVIDEIKANYPYLEYETVLSAKEGLRKISFGEADAMIIELISASVAIDEDNITNLMVNTEAMYNSDLSIATRNDWPILNNIFNKGLAQISEREKREIKAKWIPLEHKSFYENPVFWYSFLGLLILLVTIFITIFIWNLTLKKLVREKTAELEKSKEILFYKSYHDELSKVYNRAYYNEQLRNFEKNISFPFSVIVADLNGLKITNDTFGYEAGDKLIKKVAEILKEQCDTRHIISRIGGDEFVILMPKTSKEESQEIILNIKKSCKESQKEPIEPSLAMGYGTLKDEKEEFNSIFKKAEDMMYENKINESKATYEKIMISLKEELEKYSFETHEHSLRLKENALIIAKKFNLSKEELIILEKVAELHDIGIISIPKEILYKTETLSNEERIKLRHHPDLGFRILSSAKMIEVAKGILSHHERWDGLGYPNGLKSEAIPLISRIISVVDAYDVMITGRPYKKSISKKEAIEELRKFSGTQFDPEVVRVFSEYLEEEI